MAAQEFPETYREALTYVASGQRLEGQLPLSLYLAFLPCSIWENAIFPTLSLIPYPAKHESVKA